jgi:putative transposase
VAGGVDWSQKSPKERHRPPHHVEPGRAHFITAATVHRRTFLRPPERKDGLLALLTSECERFGVELIAWVVLDEHYHLIIYPERPEAFAPWISSLHTNSARAWNVEDQQPGRQVWYQFWDTTLWTEGDLWSRVNYVHYNPVKHGYVTDPADWPWSSYGVLTDCWNTEEALAKRARFPAPRKLPNDDF